MHEIVWDKANFNMQYNSALTGRIMKRLTVLSGVLFAPSGH